MHALAAFPSDHVAIVPQLVPSHSSWTLLLPLVDAPLGEDWVSNVVAVFGSSCGIPAGVDLCRAQATAPVRTRGEARSPGCLLFRQLTSAPNVSMRSVCVWPQRYGPRLHLFCRRPPRCVGVLPLMPAWVCCDVQFVLFCHLCKCKCKCK